MGKTKATLVFCLLLLSWAVVSKMLKLGLTRTLRTFTRTHDSQIIDRQITPFSNIKKRQSLSPTVFVIHVA